MQPSLLTSTQGLSSLPHVTVRVTARITAYCFKLQLSASFPSSSSSSFLLLFLLPLPVSLYPCSLSLFFPSPSILHFQLFFGARSKSRTSSPPIAWALSGVGRRDPSLLLSLSPVSRSLSPPLVVTEHTCLILASRAPSPITSQALAATSRSHPPHSAGFLGVKLISAVFASLLLRTGRSIL